MGEVEETAEKIEEDEEEDPPKAEEFEFCTNAEMRGGNKVLLDCAILSQSIKRIK